MLGILGGRGGHCQLPHAEWGCNHWKYKRLSPRATVTPGSRPSSPLWWCSLDSDSVLWEDAVPVLTSVMMARDTEKPPSLQNMKAARQTTERGGGLLYPSSEQSCAHCVEGSQVQSKVGATRGPWYSGWGQGLKSRTRSLVSYYAHFTWTISRHWCLQPRWRIHA